MPPWAAIWTTFARSIPSWTKRAAAGFQRIQKTPGRWHREHRRGPARGQINEVGSMNTRAQIRLLEDGRRLYLNDGPIDLIIEAFGETDEVSAAYHAAAQRFATVLDELCAELTLLRQTAQIDGPLPSGAIARRM